MALRDIIAARRVRSVYLGGGTPTALAPCQLERVLEAVAEFAQGEFTVEAGRPDTITPKKLSLIRQAGANRISVKPPDHLPGYAGPHWKKPSCGRIF